MIESGWIFPDGKEYACGADSFEVHPMVVQKFIRGLGLQDSELKEKIEKEIDDLFFKRGSKNLYDNYAIRRLGWIKVSYLYSKRILYAGYDWQKSIIEPYKESGYEQCNKYYSYTQFLPINCDILQTIRNGYR